MLKHSFVVFFAIMIVACAGVQVQHTTDEQETDRSAKYLVFPFRNPSYKGVEFSGVGSRFTRSFVSHCSSYRLDVVSIFNDDFQSSKDIDVSQALTYAKGKNADFIITGQVTRWIDRATEWSGKRDFAGLEVFVREANSGKVVFTAELLQHSNIFWSGTPDDYVTSLSKAMAKKFLGIEKTSR